MILTCPQCATRYRTDAAKFAPPGRKVRCAKCGHIWHQDAPSPEVEPGLEQAARERPAPEAEPQPPAPEPPQISSQRSGYVAPAQVAREHTEEVPPKSSRAGARIGMALGWIALIAAVLIIGWSAVRYRQEVATLWPQAASLYARVGLEVNARGIAFTDVNYKREMEDGQFVIAVSGKLVNISTREVPVPPIRAALTGDDKRELYHWDFNAKAATLKPGQAIPFLTRVSSPPAGARHLELRFADAGS